MSTENAEQYFRSLGELLRTEGDRDERKSFLDALRLTSEYQEAFNILRTSRRSQEESKELEDIQDGCEGCSFLLSRPMTLSELIDHRFGDGNEIPKTCLGETPWGLEYYELEIDNIRCMVVPVRISHIEEDHKEAQLIVANRSNECDDSFSFNWYPFSF